MAKSIQIAVDPSGAETFKKLCAVYGMKVKRKRGFYYEVSNYDDIDLYWLGANMMRHFADTNIKKRKY